MTLALVGPSDHKELRVKYTVGSSKITAMFKVQSKSDYIEQSTFHACRNTF